MELFFHQTLKHSQRIGHFECAVMLGGNVHKNPGPFSFCHWNLGGMATDNFLKQILLQAFLCVNDFGIVILGETHLSSKIDSDEFDTEGYSFQR